MIDVAVFIVAVCTVASLAALGVMCLAPIIDYINRKLG